MEHDNVATGRSLREENVDIIPVIGRRQEKRELLPRIPRVDP